MPSDMQLDDPTEHTHGAHEEEGRPVSFTQVPPVEPNVVTDPWSSVRLRTPNISPYTTS